MHELHSLCATLHPTAIVVSEIWLSSDVLDNERKDRNHHGRGVSAWLYIYACFLGGFEEDFFHDILWWLGHAVLWSELAKGARVPHETEVLGFERKIRSVMDEEDWLMLVGSFTTWVSWKSDWRLDKLLSSLFLVGWMLKSWQSTRFVVGVRRGHVVSLETLRWHLEVGIVQQW